MPEWTPQPEINTTRAVEAQALDPECEHNYDTHFHCDVPPVALFSTQQSNTFDAAVNPFSSTPGDGERIVSYVVTWGDGGTDTVTIPVNATVVDFISPTHTYAAVGTYSIEVTVTNDLGVTDSLTQSITVEVPSPSGEADVSITSTTTMAFDGDFVTYTGSITNNTGQQSNGIQVTVTMPAGFNLLEPLFGVPPEETYVNPDVVQIAVDLADGAAYNYSIQAVAGGANGIKTARIDNDNTPAFDTHDLTFDGDI